LWYGPWQFMYAGVPSNFSLVSEEIENIHLEDESSLSRLRVQETVRRAYQTVRSRLASFEYLSPFNITLEQFSNTGLESFGETFHGELCRNISHRASQIADQILVIGWGHSPHSVMIYEVGPSGDCLHEAAGFAAIGSGSQMAYTMLLLLGQARYRTLAETIFNVACAKFFAEKSDGLDVGRMTTMHVLRKSDDPSQRNGQFVSVEDIDKLRNLWDTHLKPQIPDEARIQITGIAARVNDGHISPRDMLEELSARQRLDQKYSSASLEDSASPQPTKDDSSRQQPSPELFGGSGES